MVSIACGEVDNDDSIHIDLYHIYTNEAPNYIYIFLLSGKYPACTYISSREEGQRWSTSSNQIKYSYSFLGVEW